MCCSAPSYLRDALIDGADRAPGSTAPSSRACARRSSNCSTSYLPDVSSDDERDHWLRLQAELGDYWASRDVAFTDRRKTPDASGGAAAQPRRPAARHRPADPRSAGGAAGGGEPAPSAGDRRCSIARCACDCCRWARRRSLVALLVAVMASRHVNGCSARSSGSGGASSRTAKISSAVRAARRRAGAGAPRACARAARRSRPGAHGREDGHRHRAAGRQSTRARGPRSKKRAISARRRCAACATCRSCCIRPMLDDFGLPATLARLSAQLLASHGDPRAARGDDGRAAGSGD